MAVAYIDWDGARPDDPVLELADAAWAYVPLGPSSSTAAVFTDHDPARRLRLLLDVYGMTETDELMRTLQSSAQRRLEAMRWAIGFSVRCERISKGGGDRPRVAGHAVDCPYGPQAAGARARCGGCLFRIELQAHEGGVPMARPVPTEEGRCD